MKTPSHAQVHQLLDRQNPWWHGGEPRYSELPRRSYFGPFFQQASASGVNRAIVLLGSRRVGKTVMLHQLAAQLLNEGVAPQAILYASVDNPLFHNHTLTEIIEEHRLRHGAQTRLFALLDEIQFQRNWDVQLKSLVDLHPDIQFVVTGSAAAALNVGTTESGAGRFSTFYLPALLLHEFLDLSGNAHMVDPDWYRSAENTETLNLEFLNYLNYGSFPEAAYNSVIASDPEKYLGRDVVNKILQSDLPTLYGISDTRELKYLFDTLAFNTGGEVSPNALSKNAGVSKKTLLDYIEYLESAFLIKRINRVDQNASRFERQRNFKVYLQNPALYTAIYGPVAAEDRAMGALAETAVHMHWTLARHIRDNTYYARWKKTESEVDLVTLDRATQKPQHAIEVKWSNADVHAAGEPAGLLAFSAKHRSLKWSLMTTRSAYPTGQSTRTHHIVAAPTSVICLHWGKRNFAHQLSQSDWLPPLPTA